MCSSDDERMENLPVKNTFIHFASETEDGTSIRDNGSDQKIRALRARAGIGRNHTDGHTCFPDPSISQQLDAHRLTQTPADAAAATTSCEGAAGGAPPRLTLNFHCDKDENSNSDTCSTPEITPRWNPTPLESVSSTPEVVATTPSQPPTTPLVPVTPPRPATPTSPANAGEVERCFSFAIRKADDVRLGLEIFPSDDQRVLMVNGVMPEGAVDAWNKQCDWSPTGPQGGKMVLAGDWIESINGQVGCQAMLAEIRDNRLLKLVVARAEWRLLQSNAEVVGQTAGGCWPPVPFSQPVGGAFVSCPSSLTPPTQQQPPPAAICAGGNRYCGKYDGGYSWADVSEYEARYG